MDNIMDLFDNDITPGTTPVKTLASRMRPENLEGFVGQDHILSENKLLYRLIKGDRIGSIILYGPPGSGKTTLANIISKTTKSLFVKVNAVTSNVAELRQVTQTAKRAYALSKQKTILFVDEIHRFSKSQQDVLLPEIEDNNIGFIGATTQNPALALTQPFISRSNIFQLEELSNENILQILKKALTDKEKGLGGKLVKIEDSVLCKLAVLSEGDVRKALNSLEIAVNSSVVDENGVVEVFLRDIEESIQKKMINYDHNGDGHYDTISAFIKSMRGSDPDATVYWLAKMLSANEDPRFIARRIVICASEDVGNADPSALSVAVSAFQALEFVGMPESRFFLAHAAIYVACAPKSNAVTKAIDKAQTEVMSNRVEKVPAHIKDNHLAKLNKQDNGEKYLYPHDYPGHFVKQCYRFGDDVFYEPTGQGYEAVIAERMAQWRELSKRSV